MVLLFCGFCNKVGGDTNSNNPPMMRCSQCKAMNYCNRECQVQHWNVHKGPCQIAAQTNRDMAAQDSKRLVRLFISWTERAPHPLDSLLDAHYGYTRLKEEICGKQVVEIETAFDYNKRTFVPTRPPRLLDLNLYRLDHPEHDLSQPEVVFMSLQLRGKGVHYNRGSTMFAFAIARMVKSGPWNKIVEQVFPYLPLSAASLQGPVDDIVEEMIPGYMNNVAQPASLHSSIFRDDSWETIKQNNLETQFELVRQSSPHYKQFIENALHIKTMQPRHKTHLIMVHVKLGLGLGQWSQLKNYRVLSLDEVMHFLHEQRTRTTTTSTVTALDHIVDELLDLDTHPEALERQNENPNPNTTTVIRVPILFDVLVDGFVMMKPIFFCIPNDMSMMKKAMNPGECDTKARKHFDELKKTISFPTVASPNLH